MKSVEHILIAYGDKISYQNGAKYQILRNWNQWYSRPSSSVCVLTDHPELFRGYPVRLLTLTPEMKTSWSLNNLQHFGIKLKGFQYAMETSDHETCILLDTDAYWAADPIGAANKIDHCSIVMHSDEGLVLKSRNVSIRRFEEGLHEQSIALNNNFSYRLSAESRMLNSRVLGMTQSNRNLLNFAYELFTQIEPLVDAHTVEQFSISEASRIKGLNVQFAKKLTSDWSSTGRKNYATPIINNFFDHRTSHSFTELVKDAGELDLRRTFKTLIRQKFNIKF